MRKQFSLECMEKLPSLPVSFLDSRVVKTGTWRYWRPLFDKNVAPCTGACPCGENIAGWIQHINAEMFENAYNLIIQDNPFPGVCGRVCYHPCEIVCNRGHIDDQNVPIHLLERFVADYAFKNGLYPKTALGKRKESNVAVVGGGPSGLCCAYHLANMGYGVTVYEASSKAGGVLRTGIPEFRLPEQILNHEVDAILRSGIDIQFGVKIGVSIPFNDLNRYDAIYIAIGANKSINLKIEGNDLYNIYSGMDFLNKVKQNIFNNLKGTVAVIGGGNTAIDVARSALRLGAKPIILYRRSRKEMPAFDDEVTEALAEGIRFQFLVSPTRLIGEGGRLKAIECVKNALTEPYDGGRSKPVPIEGSSYELEVDMVVYAIGETTDLSFLDKDIAVNDQLIVTDRYTSTSNKNFFAGGDVVFQPRTVVHAIRAGKLGAAAIDMHLQGRSIPDIDNFIRPGEAANFSMQSYLDNSKRNVNKNDLVCIENINIDYHEIGSKTQKIDIFKKDTSSFSEVNRGLHRKEALELSKHCFSCGLCNQCGNCWIFCPDMAVTLNENNEPEMNYDYCKGCGICAEECPRGVVSMVWED